MSRLHYYVRDLGDGSVTVDFFATEEEALDAAQQYEEFIGGGWEGSVGSISLRTNSANGIEFESYGYTDKGLELIYRPLKQEN